MLRTESEASTVKPRSQFSKSVLIACPLLFTGFVGIYSRNYSDEHIVPAGTPAQDAMVLSYTPYVRQANEIFNVAGQPDRAKVLQVAHNWEKGISDGKLQPLVPVSFEDSPQEGARSEIFQANSRIVDSLLDDASDRTRAGQYHQAAQEALLATRLSESLKYSDFDSVYAASAEQKRATALLKKMAPRLSPDDKVSLRNDLVAVQADAPELTTLTRYSRAQYYDYLGRMSKQPVSIEDVHRTVLVTKRIASDPTSRDTLAYIRTNLMQTPMDDGPEYLSDMRLAWASEQSNQNHLQQFLQHL